MKKLIEIIKNKGFGFIKVEMEAQNDEQIDRMVVPCHQCQGKGQDNRTCESCSGTGIKPCQFCGGSKKLYKLKKTMQLVDCPFCPTAVCGSCGGTGVYKQSCSSEWHTNNHMDAETAGGMLLEHIKSEPWGQDFIDNLAFYEAYHDGANNIEITFSTPIESCIHIPFILKHFGIITDTEGYIDNAGLHISLLVDKDYRRNTKNGVEMFNFREAMKLLPLATIVSGSDGDCTRNFIWRRGFCSDTEKYSMIYTNQDKLIEYRVFDTCYNRPETFYKYLFFIANTLKFYNDIGVVKKVNLEKIKLSLPQERNEYFMLNHVIPMRYWPKLNLELQTLYRHEFLSKTPQDLEKELTQLAEDNIKIGGNYA